MTRSKISLANTVLISACIGLTGWTLRKTSDNAENSAAIRATLEAHNGRLDRIERKLDMRLGAYDYGTNNYMPFSSILPGQFHATPN